MTLIPLPPLNPPVPVRRSLRCSDAPRRLFWSLEGPLESKIFVLYDPAQPEGPRQPYFQQTLAGTTWHPVSQEPMTTPGVSSITVKAGRPLDDWAGDWLADHEHADPDDENPVYEEAVGQDGWVYQKLVQCCGQDEPPDAPSLVVEASDKPYVTVHDYVTAVHPWLLSLRQNMVLAMSVFNPLPAGTKLVVDCRSPACVDIWEEVDWIRTQSRPRPVASVDQKSIDW